MGRYGGVARYVVISMAMEARYADKYVSKRMDDRDVIVIQYIYWLRARTLVDARWCARRVTRCLGLSKRPINSQIISD
jgi:hypothetical protein